MANCVKEDCYGDLNVPVARPSRVTSVGGMPLCLQSLGEEKHLFE